MLLSSKSEIMQAWVVWSTRAENVTTAKQVKNNIAPKGLLIPTAARKVTDIRKADTQITSLSEKLLR